MRMPGEVPQEIGRAYATVLIGCLERTVDHFRRRFDVQSDPQKMLFSEGPGDSFSFDALGDFQDPRPGKSREVWVESKGYKKGSNLLPEYYEFLAKAYVTSVTNSRHSNDYFWFVTNVPFGASHGIGLTSSGFVQGALGSGPTEKVRQVLGGLRVDAGHVESLAKRVSIGIFPDSFIRRMGILYLVKPGDNLFSVMSYVHAYADFTLYEPEAALIAQLNRLTNPSHIEPGQRLRLPWYGMPWGESEEDATPGQEVVITPQGEAGSVEP